MLADILLQRGMVTEEELGHARRICDERREFLGTALLDMGILSEEELRPLLYEQFNISFVNLAGVTPEASLVARVSPETVHRHGIMPFGREGKTIFIATSDPCNIAMIDELRLLLGCEIKPFLARRSDILGAIRRFYGLGAETLHKMGNGEKKENEKTIAAGKSNEIVEDASVIKLVNQILQDGCQSRATDIHLEPYEDEFSIRYRIDGMLYEIPVPPEVKKYQEAIISRIKVMSALNIAEKRLPQDGRMRMRTQGGDLNLRVSVLPTPYGEGVQIRLLSSGIFRLHELGLEENDLRLVEGTLRKPHGIVFVTGPTGSGKTTSLYAFLRTLNTRDRKIITIEDPIEYQQKGIMQIQTHPSIGLTFAQGLRSMLRHDPDIMMVGEVRDLETAEIAIRVALTGHLVFSTLHTNDAAGAVTRLLDMGIEPYLIASSVECVIAQRLVRLICPHCRTEVPVPGDLCSRSGDSFPAGSRVFAGKGCDKCAGTGYRGRTGIYEILMMTDAIRDMVMRRKPANEIKKAALSRGMRTLRDHGFGKIREGATTLAEVLKVTQENDSNY